MVAHWSRKLPNQVFRLLRLLLRPDSNGLTSWRAEARPSVLAEKSDPWPILAGCQLWLLRLKDKRVADADAVYATLSSRYTFARLVTLVTPDLRDSILDAYTQKTAGAQLLGRVTEEQLQRLQRAQSVAELMNRGIWPHFHIALSIARAHHVLGRYDLAARAAAEMLPAKERAGSWEYDLVEEHAWMMRLLKQPREGVRFIQLHYPPSHAAHWLLLPELARLHAAMERWDQADDDLRQFFQLRPADTGEYRRTSAAWLLAGFLKQRRGDAPGARQAWTMGASELGIGSGRSANVGGSGTDIFHQLLLGALSGQLTDAQCAVLLDRILNLNTDPNDTANPVNLAMRRAISIPPSVVRDIWSTPRGQNLARDIVFRTVPINQITHDLATLGTSAMLRHGLPGPLTESQEQLLWLTVDAGYERLMAGELSSTVALQCALAWQGTAGLLGWAGAAPRLEKSVRGPLAYFCALRYRHRYNRLDDARTFLQTALRDADPNSLLQRLAQEELSQLPPAP